MQAIRATATSARRCRGATIARDPDRLSAVALPADAETDIFCLETFVDLPGPLPDGYEPRSRSADQCIHREQRAVAPGRPGGAAPWLSVDQSAGCGQRAGDAERAEHHGDRRRVDRCAVAG